MQLFSINKSTIDSLYTWYIQQLLTIRMATISLYALSNKLFVLNMTIPNRGGFCAVTGIHTEGYTKCMLMFTTFKYLGLSAIISDSATDEQGQEKLGGQVSVWIRQKYSGNKTKQMEYTQLVYCPLSKQTALEFWTLSCACIATNWYITMDNVPIIEFTYHAKMY